MPFLLAIRPLRALMLMLAMSLAGAAFAAPVDAEKAQTVVHMLDYVGVDYPEFVRDGRVLDAGEYAEQLEFATQAVALIGQLPAVPDQPAITQQAQALAGRIRDKAPGAEVSASAAGLRAAVIQAWALSVAPRRTPDLARGTQLFDAHCAACHGVTGHGDGPLAAGMEPAPRNFHDEARMRQRSLYGLYSTIALGVDGTPMRAFAELSEDDRWALAFVTAGLRADAASVAKGEEFWRQGVGATAFADLRGLVTTTPAEQGDVGTPLDAVRAYLTSHPEALGAAAPAPLDFSRKTLEAARQAYAGGDPGAAQRLAIAAYLEGFELVESALGNVDAALCAETEREMMALRSAIGDGRPADAVSAQVDKVQALLDRADEVLSGAGMSAGTAFVTSLLILLREGLEAILVLSAIVAFVVKTGRRDALPYIHVGWIGAMALGVVTWGAARYVIDISGASREMTEGVTALLAASMLLYVGWWLHSRSNAQAWNRFIRGQIHAALGRRTLWAMSGISFLAVYRELFEVILFYETLWVQAGADGHGAVLWGIVAAIVALVLIGGAILRFSVRLPIGPFFAVTSGLLALMAVIFVGNGIAALQEAGVVSASAVRFVSLPLLGIHPTLQSLLLQVLTLALIAAGFAFNKRKAVANP